MPHDPQRSTPHHASTSAPPRVLLVTGASSGIGLATALRAAADGARLALLGRSAVPLLRAAEACREAGAAEVLVFPADVTDRGAVDAAVERAIQVLGPLDGVIHSAGIAVFGAFDTVPPEVFDQVLATNVSGTANVARAVLPDMRRRNAGVLVLVGSLEGHITPPYMSAYAASKWAVRSLARTLQIENRDRSGVSVCWLAPAGVDTPIYAQAANYLRRAERPPPPVYAAESVATAALNLVARPRRSTQVGAFNRLIELGYLVLPGLYDALVTPLFRRIVMKRAAVPASPGNAFSPASDAEHTIAG